MPQISYVKKNGSVKHTTFKTYREAKKNLRSLILDSWESEVIVYRSRRGEWGEWFEYWTIRNNKLIKFKEGWM